MAVPFSDMSITNRVRFSGWPDSLITAISQTSGMNLKREQSADDKEETLEYILNTLNEKQREVVKYRYKDGLTLTETGEKMGLTRERIRQIEILALDNLSHPHKALMLKLGISEYNRRITDEGRSLSDLLADVSRKGDILKMSVDCLEINPRAKNALAQNNIRRLGELCKFSKHELKKMRGFGVVSIANIEESLKMYGMTLADKDPLPRGRQRKLASREEGRL